MTPAPPAARPAAPRRVAIGLAGLQMGGCQINAIDLARALRARGNEVAVFAVRDDSVSSTILPYAENAGFAVTLLDDGDGAYGTAASIAGFTRGHDADVVHVFAPWLNRPAAIASALDRKTAVVETNWNMENMFWGSARVPLIVGTGSMLEEAEPRRRAAVHLMEPPIDTDADRPDPSTGAVFRAAQGIADDTVLAVLVSRVDRAMKLESILDAVAAIELVEDPSAALIIVGDGDALEEVRSAADAVNARVGRVVVQAVGHLADPRPAYNAADVVLAMGGAAIRGLAHRKPVIVLGEGGFSLTYQPDTIAHFRREGFYGHGSGVGGPELLAGHLAALVGDSARRDELGAFGLREVDTRFGLDAATTALEAIYDGAVRDAPSGPARIVIGAAQTALGWAQSLRARMRRPR
jgi:glycosyltransferase involved in cell wall biosynthesis